MSGWHGRRLLAPLSSRSGCPFSRLCVRQRPWVRALARLHCSGTWVASSSHVLAEHVRPCALCHVPCVPSEFCHGIRVAPLCGVWGRRGHFLGDVHCRVHCRVAGVQGEPAEPGKGRLQQEPRGCNASVLSSRL